MLDLKNVFFSYGAVEALHDVSIECAPGKVTCIIGRNGVGKTTLMQSIMGNNSIQRGSITVNGHDVSRLPPYKRARMGLALVPQGREIFPKLTVEENLKIGLCGRSDGQREIPGEIMQAFSILGEMRSRHGGDLSGGQQQQLAIGRALAGNPQVMLLDEPTEGIQPNIIQEIGVVLRRLADDRNMTIVLVEQYLDFVKAIGDDFYIMDRGTVVAFGPTTELSEELIDRHLKV